MHSHCIEMSMEVHQVVPPPHKSTLQKLQGRLKETFFPDDPLRQFKGQPLKRNGVVLLIIRLLSFLLWFEQ